MQREATRRVGPLVRPLCGPGAKQGGALFAALAEPLAAKTEPLAASLLLARTPSSLGRHHASTFASTSTQHHSHFGTNGLGRADYSVAAAPSWAQERDESEAGAKFKAGAAPMLRRNFGADALDADLQAVVRASGGLSSSSGGRPTHEEMLGSAVGGYAFRGSTQRQYNHSQHHLYRRYQAHALGRDPAAFGLGSPSSLASPFSTSATTTTTTLTDSAARAKGAGAPAAAGKKQLKLNPSGASGKAGNATLAAEEHAEEVQAEDCRLSIESLDDIEEKLARKKLISKPSLTKRVVDTATSLYNILKYIAGGVAATYRVVRQMSSYSSSDWKVKRKEWSVIVKDVLHHYWVGSKLLGTEVKIASKYVRKALGGKVLSRRERMQLTRTTADIFRMVPMLIFLVIPFMELLLPVALAIFPDMLPSTFQDKLKQEENLKKKLRVKLEVASFLQVITCSFPLFPTLTPPALSLSV